MKMKDKTQKVSDTGVVSNDNREDLSVEIPLYAPNMSITPKSYQVSEKLCGLEADLEGICQMFIQKASPDKFNSDYLDALIDRVCKDAIDYIDEQRSGHIRILKDIELMHKGDLVIAEERLEYILELIASKEAELAKLTRIYEKGSGFEDPTIGGE